MAYTKIHAIKATVDKAIDYICNPEKTDEKMFVSSYACSPETAAYDFKYTLDHCRENSPNKAYHLIQAFAPGEVGFEEAHRIGKELADKLLEGKYSYVVTTHIDKAIDYICNPDKTDEKMFISSYACSPETAAYDFKYTLDHCQENSPITTS